MRLSLQAKLVLAVSILAVAAVSALAWSARQSARVEFRRFQDLETHASSGKPSVTVATLGDILSGKCCTPDVMREVEETLGRINPRSVFLVVDERGEVVATAGHRATELGRVTVKNNEGETVIGFERTREGRVEGVSLKLIGVAPARIVMADGRPAYVHTLTIPPDDGPVPAVEFQGALDRQLLAATAIVSVIAIGLTWALARRTVRPIDELGRAVAALAADPDVARWNGRSTSSGELAKVYGFTDLDGSQPDAWRYVVEVQDAGRAADVTGYR
ncbi:MAG TPA: hypothetical protein VFO31_12465 [Vicinamibacterales bacterium]|nr:hypothetical protein [Vicinamibacterales bacterium]